MKFKYIFILILSVSTTYQAKAQQTQKAIDIVSKESKLDKKWLWGFSFNNSWTTYTGLLPLKAFTKPSLGFHFRVDHFFNKNLGISTGIGFQQRGFGVVNADFDHSLGNPDSTYRQRFRVGNVGIPIQLIIRNNKFIFDDAKLSFGLGFVPTYIIVAKDVFHSIEDGFHNININTDRYKRFDVPLRLSAGIDVNANGASLLRVHFNLDLGFRNLYNAGDGTYSGKNRLYGIEIYSLF